MKLLHDFIDDTQKNRKKRYKRIQIGTISDEAQKRIARICGGKISDIDIDNSGIIHAIKKAEHNLQPDDLLNVVFNAWRAKKARRDATAQRPSANVQNESPRADD